MDGDIYIYISPLSNLLIFDLRTKLPKWTVKQKYTAYNSLVLTFGQTLSGSGKSNVSLYYVYTYKYKKSLTL